MLRALSWQCGFGAGWLFVDEAAVSVRWRAAWYGRQPQTCNAMTFGTDYSCPTPLHCLSCSTVHHEDQAALAAITQELERLQGAQAAAAAAQVASASSQLEVVGAQHAQQLAALRAEYEAREATLQQQAAQAAQQVCYCYSLAAG